MFSFYEVYIPAGLKQDLTERRTSIKRYSFTCCMLWLQSKDENSPKTRDQSLSLLLPPVRRPCSSRPSPECTLTHGHLPRARDPQHGWRDLPSAPGRPSSAVAKRWASAISQGTLEAQDKGGHQQYWIQTTPLMGFLHEVEPSFQALPCSPDHTRDPLRSLDGEWQPQTRQ